MTDQLSDILQSLPRFAPELCLTAGFVLILLIEISLKFSRFENKTTTVLQWFTITVVLVSAITVFISIKKLSFGFFGEFNLFFLSDGHPSLHFVKSLGGVYLKLLAAIATCLVILHIKFLKPKLPNETYSLITASLLGVYILTMANNWLIVFLAVEVISVSSYLLVAIADGKKPAEGGLKYLLFGAISAAIMLYGISWIYGLNGSLALTEMNANVAMPAKTIIGFMALGGVFFKLSLVPFQVWTPDAYEAAPTPVVAFISTVPKIGALFFLFKISFVFPNILPIVAIISIFWGNLSALRQTNFRRMLAYSSIAQAGFLVLGVVASGKTGLEATLFYLGVYVCMNLAALLLIDILSPTANIKDLAGLGRVFPFLGILMLIVMVSLVGLPPTAGFSAKLFVFSALWERYQTTHEPQMLWIIVLGLLNAVLSLFYYLKVPYFMFFKETTSPPSSIKGAGIIIATILVFLLLWWFFMPNGLLNFIHLFS